MRTLFSKRKKLFRRIGCGLIVVILVAICGLPSAVAIYAVFPYSGSAGEAPDGFSEVDLMTGDDVRLTAWYAEPQNGAVIILVHGAGSGSNSVRDYAEMLRDNDFGVLSINLRGYGGSDGRLNRLGWNGTRDIGAAMDFLAVRDEVEAVGGLGLSMGGEVLIGAASEYPALQAVVSEGASYRTLDELKADPGHRSLMSNMGNRIAYFWIGALTGDDPPDRTMLESIEAARTTSFLFIVAGKVGEEITYDTLFLEAAGERGSLWIIPDVGHTGGFDEYPDEYAQRVVEFFTDALLES